MTIGGGVRKFRSEESGQAGMDVSNKRRDEDRRSQAQFFGMKMCLGSELLIPILCV